MDCCRFVVAIFVEVTFVLGGIRCIVYGERKSVEVTIVRGAPVNQVPLIAPRKAFQVRVFDNGPAD